MRASRPRFKSVIRLSLKARVPTQPLASQRSMTISRGGPPSTLMLAPAGSEIVFERAGLARAYALTALKFEVVATGEESGYIRITSRDGIREPALEFIMEVNWGSGNLRRKFSVLLEPR